MRHLPIATYLFLALPASTGALLPAGIGTAQDPGRQQPEGTSSGRLHGRTPLLQVVDSDEQERELRMTPVVRAVQRSAEAVVSIFLNHETAFASRGQVTEGQGSGVVLDDRGFVITNWHVVSPAVANESYSLAVKFKNGRTRDARVLSTSPGHDLALLQLELEPEERLQPIEIGRSADLMIGEEVIAIGNPQGHANTVTRGVLSAVDRSIRVRTPDGAFREYGGLLQTDAAINQGNSGGALLDITGKLIGINNAMAVGAENIGFAIPVDTVREVFETELVNQTGTGIGPWLGLQITQPNGGGDVVIASVVPGSPAARAGAQVGDVVRRLGKTEVRSRVDYTRSMLLARPGQPLPLQLERRGRRLDLEPSPISTQLGVVLAHTGMNLDVVRASQDRALAEQVTRAFYAGSGQWRLPLFASVLRVRDVDAGSPAAALGLAKGDLLFGVAVQDRLGRLRELRLDDAGDFATLLHEKQGSTLRLAILRDGEPLDGPIEIRAWDSGRTESPAAAERAGR